ncbi:M20/M25/M40 family metallo-hydrolase [Corallococcus interemptor]|uniref:M20/M25/M40 family metallo-hydrolase n=1 Tax=Corallococcus interemptor TaxID=2316720 RepID=UPI001ABF7BDB|nr:M20/M25/M40 family metallo-hydrolase [Corallococcus interemptor]
MRLKRLAPVVVSLCCATASAESRDKEVYITIGSEAVTAVRTSLRAAGNVPTLVGEANGVSVLKLTESQLSDVSSIMHDTYHRCAGFMAHDTQEEALAQLAAPKPTQSLVSYTLDNAAVVNGLFSGLEEPSIRATITQLASYTNRYYNNSSGGTQAANWLRNTWAGYAGGRTDVTVQLYTHASWTQPSVIATITGTVFPDEVVVIGGHLDSIQQFASSPPTAIAPGADDDASGVATLSEVFRVAMAKGYKPARTVKFMAYAAEEVGLLGSKAIALAHKTANTNVVGVLQLDMTNYRGSTVEVSLVTDNTNAAQNAFLGNLIDTYTGYSRANIQCGYGCSDHAAWHAQGYPASMPFEARYDLNESNPYIHTANDTLANSKDGTNWGTANHALKFARIGAAYLAELGKGALQGQPTDTQAPTVSLTSPSNGATVMDITPLTASASDNVGVSKVEFLVDGVVKGTSFASPYSYAWDSRTVAPGSHALAAKAYDNAGNNTTSAAVTVTVATDTQPPTVSLTAPASGATVTGTTSVTASASDNVGVSKVEFLVDGVVKATSVSSPYSFAWDSRTVANGSHTLAAKAYDSALNSATSTAATVTVANVSTSGTYDSTLRTVRCSAAAATCDSGTLFNGRGSLGPEKNTPNTLRATCGDGSGGTYKSDESVEALKVSTVDGSNFAAGKQVKVEASVWAYASPGSDRLDLYYTANATATTPVWTLIGTFTPPAAGANTLSATYTLPSGANQAVRAQFRYGTGSPSSACVSNSYNDRDDLVFAVQ